MTPEQQLILLMTGLCQSEEVIEDAERLLCKDDAPINYDELFRLAVENSVTSIVYKNSQKLNGIPDSFRERLKKVYYLVLRNNIVHLQETLKVSKALRESGIGVIILKGSIASDTLFNDLGLYPTGDIDLLVKPWEVHNACRTLSSLGYKMVDETEKLEDSKSVNLFNGVYYIDLQWNPVAPYFNIPNDFWWEGSRDLMKDGEPLKLLSADRYLLFSTFHLFAHGFTTLKFFSLVEAVIAAFKHETDWTKSIYFSKEYGTQRLVLVALRLVHEILGAEVPEQLIKSKLRGYRICRRVVVSGLFKKSPLFYVRIAFYLLLLAGPSALLSVTAQAVFPNPARMRSRYGLSENSKLVYIYYVLNPFLILSRRT